jgi:TonB family protein
MMSCSFSFRLRFLLAPITAYIFISTGNAQSTETELNLRLKGKPLYLRGFWRDDKLHFDSTGRIIGGSPGPLAFTLSGFDLKNVYIKPNKLFLEGQRVGLELAGGKQKRVPLRFGEPRHPEDELIHIEIDANPNGDYGPALDAIFVEGIANLVPSLPFYWKNYAQKNFLPATAAPTPPTASTSAKEVAPQGPPPPRIGREIKAPRLLHSAEPTFNNTARTLMYGGKSLVNLHVEPDGTVSHLSVVQALGLGLDESALLAVQKYTFSPAMMDGKPVLVELNVEVNFQIY